MTFDEIVTGVLTQGGFDVSTAVAGSWVHEVYRRAVAQSQWQMESLSLGTTVTGVSTYAIPERVVDIVGINLNDGSGRGQPSDWLRVTPTDMWALRAGRKSVSGSGGAFAPSYGSAGERRIELYPVPETGAAIEALAAVLPATLSGAAVPVIPEDLHGALIDGAIALGLLRMDERADSAQTFEARFERMVQDLRRRKNSRVGSGAARLQVRGFDWR